MDIGIYSIVNKVNNKRYIGISKELQVRLHKHRWALNKGVHPNKHLQAAWNKYGESSFSFEILEKFEELDINMLAEKEKMYIEKFDTFVNGYNRSLGGDGTIGFVLDIERIRKLSEAMKGNKFSLGRKATKEESLKKSIAFKNRTDHKEHSERGRKTLKTLWRQQWFKDLQFAQHMGNQYSKGHKRTDAFKQHLSKIRTGENNPFYGKKHSKETLNQLSEINKKRWEDDDYRAKAIQTRKEFMQTPEYKEKMSKAMRGDKNGKAKIDEKTAIEIKLKYLKGVKLKALVEEYPMFTKSGIQKIYRTETWKHLPKTIEGLEHMLINYQSAQETGGRFND